MIAGDAGADGLPARPATALARSGSRAVVVGTGTHAPGSALPDIPAVTATVAAVRDTLRDQCAMDESHIVTVTDPASPRPFLATVGRAAAQAEDVLLLYYIGHGLVSLENELFLATGATTDQEAMLPVEALPFAAVRRVLSASRARYVVVVLDCCFSGRASGVFGTAVASAFELTNVHGSYLLSATSPTGQALAPEGERYTAFSGALVEFLRGGSPAAPRELTLDDAYGHLERALPARGAPAPQRRAGGNAGSLVVAVNPQASPVIRPHDDRSGRTPATPPAPRSCPYPGLEAFTAADARYFRGRERLVDEILRVLAADGRRGPLAVVGRSGAGKSSLLQAGLLPALKDGRLEAAVPGARHWPHVVMTPGEHPMRTLGRRLAAGTAPDGLVLCVDQFEEVFTACAGEAERHAFIRSLCAAAARDGTPRVQVILGLRADFYDRCLDYPELAPMVRTGQTPVRPMSREELQSAIEGPADTAGLRLQEGLTRRLLLDLESAEGPGRDADAALPLLAFALRETWRKSDKRVLTSSDYEATGGIWGAVTQRAEAVYENLGQAQDASRLLLLSMVRLGDGTDDVRRRVGVEELLAARPAADEAAIRGALDAYVAARLVTVDDGTAEIAHEALLRAWPRLRQWIADDREELLDHQRLAEAARMWKSDGGPLYTGARLDEVRNWLDEEHDHRRRSLRPLERDFLRAGLRAARRRRNRRLSFITAAVAAVLVLVTGGVYAVQQRAGNQQSQAVESSVQLAQEAGNLRASDPAGAMWLSLTAYHSHPTPQARTALYDSYRTPYPLVLPGRGKGAVVSVAYGPDGHTAAASWADGSVRVWNVGDPRHPGRAAVIDAGPGSEPAYRPDGRVLAVRTARSLRLWTVTSTPAPLSSTPVASTASRSGGERWPVAFSPEGNTVAIGDGEDGAELWDVSDPRHPVRFASLPTPGAVNAVAFSPDGATLAVAGGRRVRLWDVRNPGRPAPRTALAVPSALSVAFSPDGRLLAAGGSQEHVSVWNVAHLGAATTESVNPFTANPYGDIRSIAFRPRGDVFVTTDTAGQTEVWLFGGSNTSAEAAGLPDAARPDAAAFSPDGGQLVTGDLGGTAEIWIVPAPLLTGTVDTSESTGNLSPVDRNGDLLVTAALTGAGPAGPIELWDVADPSRPVRAAVMPPGWVSGGFLPDGRTLATENSANNAIRLWDVADPRHPRARGTVPEPTSPGSAPIWSAGDGRLLIWDMAHSNFQLWDIRNIGRPTRDATFGPAPPVPSNGGSEVLELFPDDLAGVGNGDVLQLWNVSDPRHPVREGRIPIGSDAAWTEPSGRLFVMGGGSAPTAIWNLRNARDPVQWVNGIGMDAGTGAWMGDHTLAGFTRDHKLGLWNVRYPAAPVATAALPLDSGYTAAPTSKIEVSPDRRLLAAGISSGQGDYSVDVWQAAADGRSLSEYIEVLGDNGNYELAPDGGFLATNVATNRGDNATDALNAFADQLLPNGSVGIVYPLDADAVYTTLCSVASRTPVGSSWREYLPETYYRPACS